MDPRIDLPPGWTWTTLGNVGALIRGITYQKEEASSSPAEGLVPILRANNIGRSLNLNDLVYVPRGRVSVDQLVRQGDVVIAMSSGSKQLVGKAAQAHASSGTAFGAFCGVFRSEMGMDPKYTGWFFQSRAYRHAVSESSAGVNINNLRREHVEDLAFPLPPVPEQRRIVAKLDALFSQLDAAVAGLGDAQTGLKLYRQSVLKAAVEGRLTAAWRTKHGAETEPAGALLARILDERRAAWERDQLRRYEAKGQTPPKNWKARYPEPGPVNTAELPELPEGWTWSSMDQLSFVTGGITKNAAKAFDVKLPYLRVANVYANELRLDDIAEIGLRESEVEKALLAEGDLLVVEGNGSVEQIGRVALWDGSLNPCVHQNHLIKARPVLRQTAEFALFWLLSPGGRERIVAAASSTSGLHTLSISKVSGLPAPLPPLAEQKEIVAEVDRLLSLADGAAATIEDELKRAEALRESVLSKAFAGRLVPQDPADEPAEKLLDRVREEKARRAAEAKAVRRRRRAGTEPMLDL